MSTPNIPRGLGLFEVPSDLPFVLEHANGDKYAADGFRKLEGVHLEGEDRAPGAALISWAAWLLALIGAGALYVSFTAQERYVFAARHQDAASIVEALLLDLLMIVFTLLALGLSRAGKSSRTERALILASAAASAYMNVSAADTASPRSVVAYAVAPVALAVVVDRVVAVIRRHVQADEETSAWTALAAAFASAGRLAVVIVLYSLRFVLAPPSTARGLRRQVLIMTPLPAAEIPPPAVLQIEPPADEIEEPPELEGASKRARLAWWYEQDPGYGDRTAVAAAAKRLAPRVDLAEGTARAYIGRIVADLEQTRTVP